MSLIEIMLSIFVIPSQCRMSGMSAWKRMSFTPAMSSVDLKYLSAESPPRLRRLYTRYLVSKWNEERWESTGQISGQQPHERWVGWIWNTDLVTSPRARPSLRKYTTTPTPPRCVHRMHSSMAKVRYGLHVQMSEPKTSEPLPICTIRFRFW